MIPLYTSRTAKSGDVDDAFQATSRAVAPTIPTAWRRNPSTAPSPILPWILRAAATQQSQSRHQAARQQASAPTSTDATKSATAAAEPVAQYGLAASLARRGLARKDPLLARLEKKHAKATGASSGTARPATKDGTVPAVASLTELPATHWTQHKLSHMTSVSWAVFREQLGIEVEAVNRRVADATSADAKGAAVTANSASVSTPAVPAPTSRLYNVDMAAPLRCWEEAGLPYTLGRCVAAKYALPTAIQSQCVPLAMKVLEPAGAAAVSQSRDGENEESTASRRRRKKVDVVGVAETGSGKTMAYLVPLLADIRVNRSPNLLSDEDLVSQGPLGIVLVPTRELAEQVTREACELLGLPIPSFGKASPKGFSDPDSEARRKTLLAWEQEELAGIANVEDHRRQHNLLSEVRVVKLVGGEDEDAQYQALSQGAHLVVGTVGQVSALLERRLLSLSNTEFVVIDEADRMVAENQQPELIQVLTRCPTPRQTLLFTATLSAACADIAKKFLSPDGYMLVRTPYRCASIRQNFEMISLEKAPATRKQTDRDSEKADRKPSGRAEDAVVAAARRKQLSSLVHPEKFARLVAWLAYGTGPIVVFAGERRTCDALQDELRREKEHLLSMEEHTSMEALVGPPPAGLLFIDDNDEEESHIHMGNAGSQTDRRVPLQAERETGDGGLSTSALGTGRRAAAAGQRYAREVHRRQALESAAAAKARLNLDNLSSTAVVHSDLSQAERRRLVELFRSGQRKVLITTDLLARGLDVPGLTLVVNYDLPWPAGDEAPAEAVIRYVHRIGRTGRAGSSGVTVSFVALPADTVQKSRQRLASAGPSGGSRGSAHASGTGVAGAVGKVYAPGTSEAVKQRDRELAELTRTGIPSDGFGIDEETINRADDYASSDDGDDETDGDAHGRHRRRRLENGSGGVPGDDDKSPAAKFRFASDEPILKPLWEFLCKCVSANRLELTSSEDAEMLLKRQWYGKIDMEPALAAVMSDRASHGSKFGVIRN